MLDCNDVMEMFVFQLKVRWKKELVEWEKAVVALNSSETITSIDLMNVEKTKH